MHMPAPTFTLVDDGTMDTVLQCDFCHREERYNFEGVSEKETEADYQAYLEECKIEAGEWHECIRGE